MTDPTSGRSELRDLARLSPADYVLAGGIVRAGSSFAPAEAVRVADGIIVAVGDLAEVESDGVPVFDLDGAVVLPGLHDTHFHMMSTGANKRAVDLFDAGSIEGVLEAMRVAPPAPGTDWVIGGQLDESRIAERRAPTLAELDETLPDIPVYINDRGLHYSIINSAAAVLLGLEKEAAEHDGRMQEDLSGLAKERLGRVLPLAYAQDNLRYAAKYAADLGLTTLHAMEGGELFDDADVPVLDALREDLPVRVHLLWSTEDVASADRAGYRHAGGDVCADGSIGSRTARLSADYADAPGERGVTLRDADRMTEIFAAAEAAGIQYGVHAIGDAGVGDAVEAIARVCPEGTTLRHRIEHFGMPSPDDIARVARLGIGVSTQPGFAFLRGQPGGVYESRLGAERLATAYPLRSLLDAGIVVSGGSDSDVTSADPVLGIHSAVNHPQVGERVSVAEAVTMYTGSAEWMAGGDPHDAYINPGTRADLTILDTDPFTADPTSLSGIRAVATIVRGASVGR